MAISRGMDWRRAMPSATSMAPVAAPPKIQTDSGGISSKSLTPESMAGLPEGVGSLAKYLRESRERDMSQGQGFASQYFGSSNPQMAEILRARQGAAFGGDTALQDQQRARGIQGINSTMATGLRGLKGAQAVSGIRGGAAIGQALPMLTKANQARGQLESDISIDALNRRDAALNNYESTLTGERAGELGTIFGMAGLGAGDRTSAMQYNLGKDYLKAAQIAALTGGGAGGGGGGGGSKGGIGGFFGGLGNRLGYEDLFSGGSTAATKALAESLKQAGIPVANIPGLTTDASSVFGGGGDEPFYKKWGW